VTDRDKGESVNQNRTSNLTTATLLAIGLTAMVALVVTSRTPSPSRLARGPFDILITGGRILDGSGNPWYRADLGLLGDRIVAVGDLAGARASRTIDAGGLYIAPGFIDVHTHAAGGLVTAEGSPARPLLAQGVTTAILNPDGGGSVDLEHQRHDLEEHGLGINVGLMIGHGSIRRLVIGMEDRPPDDRELQVMSGLVREAMEAGAFGLSSGPFYTPGSYADTDEIAELARLAASYGGVHTSHIRDESDYTIGLLAAVEELITISRMAGIPGVVTHIKALGPNVWGLADEVVTLIERARAGGLEIWADQYPYEASSTGLAPALLPRWAQAGGRDALIRRFDDPAEMARIRTAMTDNLQRRGGADRIVFSRSRSRPEIEGRSLEEVAVERGLEPVEAAVAILREGSPSIISFNMHDADITTFMRQPWTMTSTDGDIPVGGNGMSHPRSFGTFPRKIRKYALEEGVLDLAGAVRSMTSLPATVFHLTERGSIRAGAFADLAIFNLERLRDTATWSEPDHLAEGMEYVFVNGRPAIDGGVFSGDLAGRVLTRH
jgi:N-acyl-D-aspartate/D-glutamate deacylase